MTLEIAAISPHADDSELGLGASIYDWSSSGLANVTIYVLAAGSASEKAHSNESIRHHEAMEAANLLKANVEFLKLASDSMFQMAPRGPFVRSIEDLILREKPWDQLYIPLPSFHQDHTVTYEAIIAALRPRKNLRPPAEVLAYEYPGQAWGPPPPDRGKVYHAVSMEAMKHKKQALACHKSQWVDDPSAPMLGWNSVDALAKLRGGECYTHHAEMFYLIRSLRGSTGWGDYK